jgi:hypothetical protein
LCRGEETKEVPRVASQNGVCLGAGGYGIAAHQVKGAYMVARVQVWLAGALVRRQGHGYELAGSGAVSLRLDTHDAVEQAVGCFSRCHGGDVYGARVSGLGSRGFAGKLEAGLLARLA